MNYYEVENFKANFFIVIGVVIALITIIGGIYHFFYYDKHAEEDEEVGIGVAIGYVACSLLILVPVYLVGVDAIRFYVYGHYGAGAGLYIKSLISVIVGIVAFIILMSCRKKALRKRYSKEKLLALKEMLAALGMCLLYTVGIGFMIIYWIASHVVGEWILGRKGVGEFVDRLYEKKDKENK